MPQLSSGHSTTVRSSSTAFIAQEHIQMIRNFLPTHCITPHHTTTASGQNCRLAHINMVCLRFTKATPAAPVALKRLSLVNLHQQTAIFQHTTSTTTHAPTRFTLVRKSVAQVLSTASHSCLLQSMRHHVMSIYTW